MARSTDKPTFYEFGPFRLIPAERRLLRDRVQAITLTPKAFDTLLALVEHAGHLLKKEDLLALVWPDTFVEQATLAKNVFTIRKALGHHHEIPLYVETVPKIGYRFIAPVHAGGNGTAVAPEGEQSENPPAKAAPAQRAQTSRKWAFGAVTALAAIALGWWGLGAGARSGAHRVSLAVLPFQNLTGDTAEEYLSDGFTDEMISELSQLRPGELAVIGRTSAMHYKHSAKTVGDIGRELAAEYVLEGSVRRSDARVRIGVQLIRVRDGAQLWTENYDRDLQDVLDVESDVARAVAMEINVQFAPPQTSSTVRSRPVAPRAYENYLRGRSFWNTRSREGLIKAVEHLERAIAEDPRVPRFYAALADAYALLGSLPDSPQPRPEAMERARSAAQKALAMDESGAEAHASLAFVRMHYEWNWEAAEREFRRALALNAGYPTAHHWYAYYLVARNRGGEATREILAAQQLDPLSIIIKRDVAEMFYFDRRYDEAIEQCRKTLTSDPEFFLAHLLMGAAYQQKRMYPEMFDAYRMAFSAEGDPSWTLSALGLGYAAAGKIAEADQVLGQLKLQAQAGEQTAYSIAGILARLNRRDEAFAWLDTAYRQRNGSMILLQVDPLFDSVRDDPRFGALLRAMRLTS